MINEQLNIKKIIRNFIVLLILLAGYNLFINVFKSKTTEELWNSTWTTFSFDDHEIKIDLPVKLGQLSFSESNPNLDNYAFESRHLAIGLNVMKFDNELEISVSEFANRRLDKFASLMNFTESNLKDDIQDNSLVNVISGSVSLDNEKYELTDFCAQKGTTYYSLTIYHKQDDQYGRKIKNRIISSVKM